MSRSRTDEARTGVTVADVWAEQAIFTSLPRLGRTGYHLVARSPGVSEAEASALTTWSPSHGALIVDEANRTNLSFYALPGGRFALARTCEGLGEYSGRGGRQLYTHALIVDDKTLKRADYQPFALLRDAMALGHLRYCPEPESHLRPVRLSSTYRTKGPADWSDQAKSLGLSASSLGSLLEKLTKGQPVSLAYDGDRTVLAECLIGLIPAESRARISFATSLRPSLVRPFQLVLVDGTV